MEKTWKKYGKTKERREKMNTEEDFIQFGKDFYLDLIHDVVEYKGSKYLNADLERKTKAWASMKRFLNFLYFQFQETKVPVDYLDLYIAYGKKFNRTNISDEDREKLIRKYENLDSSTVYKMYKRIAQMIVNFEDNPTALDEMGKKECYIKRNSEDQYWYESATEIQGAKGEKESCRTEKIISNASDKAIGFGNNALKKDDYYINEIKERALQLYSENRIRALNILENILFIRRQELSGSARSEIDQFFADEFIVELVRQGLSEELASWYSLLWYLWAKRKEFQEGLEKAKMEQEYDRIEMKKRNLNRHEDIIDEIIEKITTYNQAVDKGGNMQK